MWQPSLSNWWAVNDDWHTYSVHVLHNCMLVEKIDMMNRNNGSLVMIEEERFNTVSKSVDIFGAKQIDFHFNLINFLKRKTPFLG